MLGLIRLGEARLGDSSLRLAGRYPQSSGQHIRPRGRPEHGGVALSDQVPDQPPVERRNPVSLAADRPCEALHGARFEDAYAFFSADQKRTVAFEAWRADRVQFRAKVGAFEGRTIRKLTWYRNPPGAQPGIYVAADFSDQFENAALHCGYVAWHQRMDGSFEIVHEEDNLIDKPTAARMSPEMLQRAHAAFKC